MSAVPAASVPEWLPLQQLFMAGAALLSVAVAKRLDPSDRRWSDALRSRFVLGVPWGTVVTILLVLSVYWIVQGGWERPHRPLVIPFRSWSYFYPLGIFTSGFAHDSVGHIRGNLLRTVVFAPIVEYVWSHYPTRRGAETFSSLRTNPFARILAVPAGSIAVGIFTGAFALGPVIGFSGVVYAFMGFALVTRPLLSIGGLVVSQTVSLFYRSLRNPRITGEGSSQFVTPWWADIAVQGHAIGLLAGVAFGLALLGARRERPRPLYLWLAALVFAVDRSLWAVYAPVGAGGYIMFRAVGLGLTFLLAALIVSAVTAPRESVLPRVSLPGRRTATALVFVVLLALSASAIPFNVTAVSGPPDAEGSVEVRDYTVAYVEGEVNQYASVIDFGRIPFFDSSQQFRSSGVVVHSERRRIWIETVSKGQLAHRGRATIRVGGLGWRERVFASREGWSAVGNGSTYRVHLWPEHGQRRLAYAADPVRAQPTIAGRNVSIHPAEGRFEFRVTRGNETLGQVPAPSGPTGARVGGLTLNRTDQEVFAIRNGTRVKVAQKQVPRGQQERAGTGSTA